MYAVKSKERFKIDIYLKKKKKRRYYILIFLLPAIIIYTCFMALPLFNSMIMSFFTGEGLIPNQFCGFENYVKLFTKIPYKERFFNALRNNVKFFLMVLTIQNLGGLFISILVTRKFRGNTFFRRITYLPTTLSVLVAGFLFCLILNPVWGLFDQILAAIGLESWIRPWLGDPATALPAISFVTGWQYLGIPILFFTAAIDGIDESIFEAAKIDGAGTWQTVKYIIIPLITPVIGIITILTFVGNFTGFDIIYAMAGSTGAPGYATDIFGTLFYRAAFAAKDRGGWGIGMGATVASVTFIIIFLGVMFFLFIFKVKGIGKKK
jgi:raffinose/stachyose/melibiose transport system permease protein